MIKIKDSVSVSTRTMLSIQFVQSAALFARHAHRLEQTKGVEEMSPSERGKLWSEHKSFAIASVVASVMFLESMINELFLESFDEIREDLAQLSDNQIVNIQARWKFGIPNDSRFYIQNKYEAFLNEIGAVPFERGSQVYQDAGLVIKLRNALTHYQPYWHEAQDPIPQQEQHDLQRSLRSRFVLNPFAGKGNAFFPTRCLSHGCAEWALKAVISFSDLFTENASIKSPFIHVRGELGTRHEA